MQTTLVLDSTGVGALDISRNSSGDESRLRVWESEGGQLQGDSSAADRPASSDLQVVHAGRRQW